LNFEYAPPAETGIQEQWLMRFLSRLEQQGVPMHSAIVMRGGKICLETYYKPYDANSLHRMFSTTKSLVAMAVGILIGEGKLSLSDHIVDYFPEKQPSGIAYPYTAMLTIKDMLEMKTCHHQTTYKQPGVTDWVGSFFTTPPSHVPGTSFAYDTSSTHVLGALVEKLTGMTILDFMREKCLDELGFSKDSCILPDPNGVGMGGSGLCATTRDLLLLIMLVAGNGNIGGKQYIPADFMRDARTKHSDPLANQGTLEEMQGYGYQIWLTRHGGNVLFGMGGQLALYLPDEDIYMVTTADTQGRQGGVQLIYDAFFEEIYDKLTGKATYATPDVSFTEFINSRQIAAPAGEVTSAYADKINCKKYLCSENKCGIGEVCVRFDSESASGVLNYTNAGGKQEIRFTMVGAGGNVVCGDSAAAGASFVCADGAIGKFPEYGFRYSATATWRMENYLLIKVNIIDSDVGSLYIGLNYKENYVTVVLRKFLEYKLDEYVGVFSGKAED
jgi:CubicO group peptidase (beta-lactamase class C family)